MFFLDKLFEDNQEYPNNGSVVEKFLFYRKRNDDIDVDVCEENVNNYKKTNPLINNNAEIRLQKKSRKKYELIDGESCFRGETLINCMQIILQIVNYDNDVRETPSL